MNSIRPSVRSLMCGFAAMGLALSAPAVNPPIRIMPVGDSITDGSPVPGGYRAPLYVALTNAGYNVDYVGTLTINPAPTVMPDPDHEGHSGWTIAGIDGGILGWFSAIADPDVILLHIGTNDSGDLSTAVARYGALVTKMATARPLAHIIVTSLMKRSDAGLYANITNLFNPFIPNLVTNQVALGHRVTFLDMNAYLELADMADGLHPNQTGYNKMAAAWFPAITNVISPAGDLTAPSLSRAAGNSDHQHVAVTFSKPLDAASATNIANYAINNGLTVSGATLSNDLRTVTLSTSTQTAGTLYAVTVNNVADLTTPTPLVIAANSTATFTGVRIRGYLNNVPESSAYKLVYTLDLPNSADYLNNAVAYTTDNAYFNETFSRVAYYMELQTSGGELQYLWASMDAFATREDKLGVPTVASGAIYQQTVNNMNIFCNVAGVTTGTVINTGNLEFWPSNYETTNSTGVAGASNTTFDFGDKRDDGGHHGSMQLHNYGAAQTLFAVNNWGGEGGNLGIGIGNCPSPVNGGVDWTFAGNSATYTVKTLQVLVIPGSPVPPTMTSVQPNPNRTAVDITFGKPLEATSATDIANYAINNGITVLGASISANLRTVTLTTSTQTAGSSYTVTVSNVADLTTPTPLTIAPNSTVTFMALTTRGYLNNVPESSNYTLVYSLDIPASVGYHDNQPAYSVNNSANSGLGSFSRVAYYMELQKPGADIQYVWVSMDAFTNRADKLGVPTLQTGAVYQQRVSNMNVVCNVPGVVNGTGITTGNLEFWPYNYNGNNAANVPNANGSFDFGDTCDYVWDYGCMQVHNYGASQTLFAFNHWGTGGTTPCIGIGNCPSPVNGGVDWTFADNANDYTVRSLQVLVLRADSVPPVPVSAYAGSARTLVTVTFSEPLAATSVDYTRFTLDHGVTVQGATLLPDLVTVNLTTTGQPAGVPLTLTVNGIRDLSANPVPAGTTIAVSEPVLPPEIVSNVGTNSGQLAEGYQLVYTLDIPVLGNFNGAADPYRVNQSVLPGAFDRIAYYVELQKTNGTVQYLWASMDAFTTDKAKIAVPTVASGAVYQQYVNNLQVLSNVAGISNGTFVAGGNLEFWPGNYSEANAMSIPGASGTTFDFGDTMVAGSGHGSMQIHNSGALQTLFAMNHWGNDGLALDLGIGNQPVNAPDWTFASNAGTAYTRRLMHILVRPVPVTPPTPPALPSEVAANVPGAAGYTLAYTIDLPAWGDFYNNAAAYYTVNNTTNGLWAAFSRVAYYLELQSGTGPTQFIWTAMDAFTTDARKIGVPTNNVFFQQRVANLDVLSNVGGIVNGTGLATGNIEFWPSNYGNGNSLGIPNARDDKFDFGDGGGGTGNGYGSMQVHNYGASQTLFAVNNFNNGNLLCIGIGNNPGDQPDWTFQSNANGYNFRRLHVFVLPSDYADIIRPTLFNVTASRSLNQVAVVFNETVSDSAATPSFFTLNNGVSVTAAKLLSDKKTVVITTTAMTAGQSYTLSVTGVRDRSPNANAITPNSAAVFTAPPATLPPVLANVPEASGYALIYQLAVPNTAFFVPNGAPYTIDESKFPQAAFDRVAYCMELSANGSTTNWVYVSLDAFTTDIAKIGVPTAERGAVFQQYINNLHIYAAPGASVITGVVATGNIEFWPSSYGQNNDLGIPGASSGTYDFGDSWGNASPGHGSMQIHNYLAGQTIFAMNHFGDNWMTPALGIGNDPVDAPDWTFTYNAGDYSVKNIYVLARWSSAVTGTQPDIWSQPQSLHIRSGGYALFNVYAPTGTAYQWRHNGIPIAGANLSWLEINPADLADGGTYDVLVYGAGTAYTASQSATLAVLPLGTVLKLR